MTPSLPSAPSSRTSLPASLPAARPSRPAHARSAPAAARAISPRLPEADEEQPRALVYGAVQSVDTEAAARKRQEIGLSPRRATAQGAIARPPPRSRRLPAPRVLLAGGAALLILLALLLAGRGIQQRSTRAALAAGAPTLADDFASDKGLLVRDFQPRRWSMGPVPTEGLYRIRMWPGVIAWSTLGAGSVANFHLATDVTVAPETPWGYGGLIARYSDDANLYLVQVDGAGRFRIQLQRAGVWQTLQDWTSSAALHPAGAPNHLELSDGPDVVTVTANGTPLFSTQALDLPAGDVGVVAGSLEVAVAEANFDTIALDALP